MKGGVITIPKYELKECRNGTGSFWFIDFVPYILIRKREADSLENKSSPTILSPTRR